MRLNSRNTSEHALVLATVKEQVGHDHEQLVHHDMNTGAMRYTVRRCCRSPCVRASYRVSSFVTRGTGTCHFRRSARTGNACGPPEFTLFVRC